MQLKLKEYVRITFSLNLCKQNRDEILLFRTFSVKVSMFALLSLEIGYFEFGDD